MEQPPGPESRCDFGVVHSRPARMGLELHGGHRTHSYGAGVSLWRLQVSPGTHVGRGCISSPHDTRHGVQRTNPALRPRRVLGLGASVTSRIPILGPSLVKLLLGGPIIAGATLSRFFTLHVFVIPGLLIAFVGLHLLMVLKLGINEWPMPGRLVRKATYEAQY